MAQKITEAQRKDVKYSDNGTPSDKAAVVEQMGWSYHTTPGATSFGDVTITFPVAFTELLNISAIPLGYKSGSNPSGVSDFPTGSLDSINIKTLSNSAPTIRILNSAGTNWGSGERHGFMWIAKGRL